MRKIVALAVLLLGATACTPEEVHFWTAYHAEKPAEAEAHLDELGLTDAAVATVEAERNPVPPAARAIPNPDGNVIAASTSCPAAVTLLNTDVNAHAMLVQSGVHQTPLTAAGLVLGATESMTVDLTGAGGERATVFMDGGAVWSIEVSGC